MKTDFHGLYGGSWYPFEAADYITFSSCHALARIAFAIYGFRCTVNYET